MTVARIIASPPRVQMLPVETSQDDLVSVLPEIIHHAGEAVKVTHLGLAWRGYRDLDDFVIDKGLDLLVEGDPLDIQVYCQALAQSGTIGNIILYILDKGGDRPVVTLLMVDDSDDDVVLSQIVKEAAVPFIDGYIVTIAPHSEGGRVYRLTGHFMIVDQTVAATRTSFLYTRLVSMNVDVRLFLTEKDSQVYYFEGSLEEEEEQSNVADEALEHYAPGTIEELKYNLRKEVD